MEVSVGHTDRIIILTHGLKGANGGTAPGQDPHWIIWLYGQSYCTVHVQTQEEAMEWESADLMRELTSQFSKLTLGVETLMEVD